MRAEGLVSIVEFTNGLLFLAFCFDLLFRSWKRRAHRFYFPWLLYWLSDLVQYLGWWSLSQINATTAAAATADFIQPFTLYFLFVAADLVDSEEADSATVPKTRRANPWVDWAILCGLMVAIPLLVTARLQTSGTYLMSFVSMAFYAGRYGRIAPTHGGWVTLLLYLYASVALGFAVTFEPSDSLLPLGLLAISVPLKIVLYYTGYVVLRRTSPVPVRTVKSPGPSSDITEGRLVTPTGAPPEPTVSVQFTDFWAFLYMLCRYPSGKALVALMVASLAAAVAFLASNLGEIAKAFIEAIRR